jgi:Rod binding domain-containing protein
VDPRLKPAAQEFEASLMQELLKPMEKDPLFASSGGNGGSMLGEAGGSTWSSLGAQSLAKAMAEAGGFGIANKIMAELAAEAKQAHGAKPAEAGATESERKLKSGSASEPLEEREEDADLKSWATVRRLP